MRMLVTLGVNILEEGEAPEPYSTGHLCSSNVPLARMVSALPTLPSREEWVPLATVLPAVMVALVLQPALPLGPPQVRPGGIRGAPPRWDGGPHMHWLQSGR